MQHLEIETSSISLKNELSSIGNLFLDSVGPLLASDVGQMWQALDDNPIFIILVPHPVIELGVNCDLRISLALKPSVTILEIGHSVLVVSDLLLDLGKLHLTGKSGSGQKRLGLIKDMEHVVEASDWGEKLPIGTEVLSRKARQQMKIWLLMGAGNHGKSRCDLCEPVVVPGWLPTI